ncbi:hypothetical protein L1765_05160 [Microaerobacter geothermalis]|uniref:hypothetical protein n=1 Tax=Microaerobacter geothermalis TaxID=674972 RepID=UPI001F35FF44|nr:hypothetical protein [Microaerobacter geothermalis]MCF6093386.1 hypothetical protein [Microaerobacter geothermalis]
MKKKILFICFLLLAVTLGASVYAYSDHSLYGELYGFPLYKLLIDGKENSLKALNIYGKIYIPADVYLQKVNGTMIIDDNRSEIRIKTNIRIPSSSDNNSTHANNTASNRSGTNSNTFIDVINPKPVENYTVGMLSQDLKSLKQITQLLLKTSDQFKLLSFSVIQNRDDAITLNTVKNHWEVRKSNYEAFEDRLDDMKDAIKELLGSTTSRNFEKDTLDHIEDAIYYKGKALDNLEDWYNTSDEDDYEDYKDYDRKANGELERAIREIESLETRAKGALIDYLR